MEKIGGIRSLGSYDSFTNLDIYICYSLDSYSQSLIKQFDQTIIPTTNFFSNRQDKFIVFWNTPHHLDERLDIVVSLMSTPYLSFYALYILTTSF